MSQTRRPRRCCGAPLASRGVKMRHGRGRMHPGAPDLLGVGIYSVPEASRLTGIHSSRLRRWFRGYDYARDDTAHHSPEVIHGELPVIDETLAISFLDLLEARCINEFRDRGVAWRAIREAHQ